MTTRVWYNLTLHLRLLSVSSPVFLLVWHAPLEVRSAKCRHQSPEWTILSHVDCFIQGLIRERLLDFRSCWIVFIHVVQECPGGLIQFTKRELLKSSWVGICFVCHSHNVAE